MISKINTKLNKAKSFTLTVLKEMKICLDYPRFSAEIELRLVTAAAYSILWLTRFPAAGYELQLSRSLAAGYKLHLSQVPTAGYKLRLTPSYGWHEFRRLDTGYSWFYPAANSSTGGRIQVTVDDILRLTRLPTVGYDLRLIPSCGWFYSDADSSPPAGLDLWRTYTLIYQVNLRTYSAKYTISMVCFLPLNFSYHWLRLWLLLQEHWRSLRKLEEA